MSNDFCQTVRYECLIESDGDISFLRLNMEFNCLDLHGKFYFMVLLIEDLDIKKLNF